MIAKHQRLELSITAKYKNGKYHKGYFCGGINTDLNIITCKDKIVIPSKIQSYALHWYHTYLLHPVMDRTETMILQNLYWPGIRDSIQKELNNCDTCQCKKLSDKKYGKLPSKLAE